MTRLHEVERVGRRASVKGHELSWRWRARRRAGAVEHTSDSVESIDDLGHTYRINARYRTNEREWIRWTRHGGLCRSPMFTDKSSSSSNSPRRPHRPKRGSRVPRPRPPSPKRVSPAESCFRDDTPRILDRWSDPWPPRRPRRRSMASSPSAASSATSSPMSTHPVMASSPASGSWSVRQVMTIPSSCTTWPRRPDQQLPPPPGLRPSTFLAGLSLKTRNITIVLD